MKRYLLAAFCLIIVVLVIGCSKETRVNLSVKIEKEGEMVPISNVKFEILPYDISKLREGLVTINKPGDMPPKDSMLAVRSKYEQVLLEYENTLDVLENTERDLKQIKDTRSSAYRSAFNKHEKAKQVNDEKFIERNSIEEEYLAAREAYETQLEEWKTRAYAGFEDTLRVIRETRKITDDYIIKTDKEGKGSIVVPGGDWWVTGRVRNPNKKYTFYFWNLQIEANGGTYPVDLDSNQAQVVEE
jgi:hypothetical protein